MTQLLQRMKLILQDAVNLQLLCRICGGSSSTLSLVSIEDFSLICHHTPWGQESMMQWGAHTITLTEWILQSTKSIRQRDLTKATDTGLIFNEESGFHNHHWTSHSGGCGDELMVLCFLEPSQYLGVLWDQPPVTLKAKSKLMMPTLSQNALWY